ncbi:helix-turn-helix domain-containing protein [Streptomyces albidoflavus]|uniref:helix-turn-helix domain-containing protein n=1 Tax=Streptomyces albidoflavus TaxID=1886 RepID=UPI0033DE1914
MAPYKARPTIRKAILGKKLATAREAAGISVEEIAKRAGVTPPAIYRMESAVVAAKATSIPFFAKEYGITDEAEIERWVDWAKKARQRGVWTEAGGMVGPTFADYADAESLSKELRFWELGVLHGLLQTRQYSEEVIRAASTLRPGQVPSERDEVTGLVKLREARKKLLEAEDGPRVWAVVGEAAVVTPPVANGRDAHREQIQHLLNLGETRVTIQVLPFSTGLHTGMSGSFTIMSLEGADMVFREGYGDGSFIDDDERVHVYRGRYERLQAQALSISASRAFLHKTLREI